MKKVALLFVLVGFAAPLSAAPDDNQGEIYSESCLYPLTPVSAIWEVLRPRLTHPLAPFRSFTLPYGEKLEEETIAEMRSHIGLLSIDENLTVPTKIEWLSYYIQTPESTGNPKFHYSLPLDSDVIGELTRRQTLDPVLSAVRQTALRTLSAFDTPEAWARVAWMLTAPTSSPEFTLAKDLLKAQTHRLEVMVMIDRVVGQVQQRHQRYHRLHLQSPSLERMKFLVHLESAEKALVELQGFSADPTPPLIPPQPENRSTNTPPTPSSSDSERPELP